MKSKNLTDWAFFDRESQHFKCEIFINSYTVLVVKKD